MMRMLLPPLVLAAAMPLSVLALCPNNNELHIYEGCNNPDMSQWRRAHVLAEVSTLRKPWQRLHAITVLLVHIFA